MVDKNGNDTNITLPAKAKSNRIIIRPSPNGDSRTATEFLNREVCHEDIMEHIRNVQLGMNLISKKIAQAGMLHDKTKVIYVDEYIDLVMAGVTGEEFKECGWWFKHIHEERHHLNDNVPVDVNLIDVIEMLVDGVMSSRGRLGVLDSNCCEISADVLMRAYWNTVEMLNDMVVCK